MPELRAIHTRAERTIAGGAIRRAIDELEQDARTAYERADRRAAEAADRAHFARQTEQPHLATIIKHNGRRMKDREYRCARERQNAAADLGKLLA